MWSGKSRLCAISLSRRNSSLCGRTVCLCLEMLGGFPCHLRQGAVSTILFSSLSYVSYIVSMSPGCFYHCVREKVPFWDMRHLCPRWRISSPGMYAIPVGDRADENLSRFHGGGNLVQVVMCPIYGKGNAPRVNQSFLKTPLIGFFPDSIVLPWRRCGYRCVKVLSCVIRIGFFIDAAAVKTPTAGEENSLCHRFCTLDKAS